MIFICEKQETEKKDSNTINKCFIIIIGVGYFMIKEVSNINNYLMY